MLKRKRSSGSPTSDVEGTSRRGRAPAQHLPAAQVSQRNPTAVSPPIHEKPPKIPIKTKAVHVRKQQYLADIIAQQFARSTFDSQERSYLLKRRIKECIVTMATVEKELRRAPSHDLYDTTVFASVSTWVVTHASKVFAITIQCHSDFDDLLSSILNFYNEDFEDRMLPISDPRAPDLESDRPPRAPAFPPDIWTDQQHEQFFQLQWGCLAPVFVPDQYEYDLWGQCIMPFTMVQGIAPRSGSFGSVFKVTVHQEHQQIHSSLKVAIKEIKSMGTWEIEKAWATEARALQATNRLNHPHILKGIAVIHQDKSRYFMFPCAENSLRDYWEATPAQSPSPRLIREGVNQVRGLADALDKLHNFRSHISQNEKFREVEIGHDLVDKSPPLSPSGMDDDDVASFHPNSLWEESIRHGDIKPENILRFLAKTSNTETLKLADIGLAKENSIATEQQRGTSMRYGTRRYEGPEVLDYVHGRSRLFDVWALGCVTFEYILWLLYGNHAIVEFYRQAEISSAPSDFQYYQVQMMGEGQQRAAVHPIVVEWLDHMQNEDPECQPDSKSMMKDLLHIVREKLLVVDLPPTRGSALSIGGGGRILVPSFVGVRLRYRATAAEFRDGLEIMERKAWDPSYVFTGRDRSHVNLPSLQKTLRRVFEGSYRQDTISSIGIKTGSLLRPSVASRSLLHPVVVSRSISAVYSRPSLDSWKFDVDNEFAEKVMKDVDVGNFREHETTSHRFCKRCAKLNFWSSGFEIEDEVGALAKSAANCELCQLLHDASCGTNNLHNGKICFERTQSVITMTGSTFPVLSLMRSPELVTPIAIQIGKPRLADLRARNYDGFFELACSWLEDCDTNHTGCQSQRVHNLPTRLIDVGTLQTPILRLMETQHETILSPHYIALSHPWGDIDAYEAFVTLRKDDDKSGHDLARFKHSIPYEDLPSTFKHAVDCTRNLKVRYLWIDSICIIQGKDGDFAEEAKKMEDVFSGAYCVIAASSAGDQRDGFLNARPQRKYVAFQPDRPFYVCQIIDRFNEDVIMGRLNQRGWVLQERALARRTMFFTKNQTYFECGNGVRCETLTQMHNDMADFLGDSKFPDKAMRVLSRPLKVVYFQGLYKQYSRLNFTRWTDRPIAIAGLEARLQRLFDTKGRYGIFDDGDKAEGSLFHRSLLWRRAWDSDENRDGNSLEGIDFSTDINSHVPSWSWMAYKGGIDYTDPPYRSATWETRELIPPWTRGGYLEPEANEPIAIAAVARDFDVEGNDSEGVKIAYDTGQGSGKKRVRCVIVAKSIAEESNFDKRYYVLLVVRVRYGLEDDRWVKCKRVGAGFMPGKYIAFDEPGTEVRIY